MKAGLLIACVLLPTLMQVGCIESKPQKQSMKDDLLHEFEGIAVSEALNRLGKSLSDGVLIDEPPGKLRALEFDAYSPTNNCRQLRLSLVYAPNLFSSQRDWSDDVVLSSKVSKASWVNCD